MKKLKLHIRDYEGLADRKFHEAAYKYIPEKEGFEKDLHGYRNISFVRLYEEIATKYREAHYCVECHTTGGYIPITNYSGTDETKAVQTFLKLLEGFNTFMEDISQEDIKEERKERLLTEIKISEIEALARSI